MDIPPDAMVGSENFFLGPSIERKSSDPVGVITR